MSKINFKKMDTVNLKNYLVNNEVVKTVTTLYGQELKNLKEQRKELIEEGKIIEAVGLHDEKVNIVNERIRGCEKAKKAKISALQNLVSETFYTQYRNIMEADETEETEKAWLLAVADFLTSLGCTGITENTATKFVNITAYKWSGLTNGKVKSFNNFAICIASDLSALAIAKNLINMDEVNAKIDEELLALNLA